MFSGFSRELTAAFREPGPAAQLPGPSGGRLSPQAPDPVDKREKGDGSTG